MYMKLCSQEDLGLSEMSTGSQILVGQHAASIIDGIVQETRVVERDCPPCLHDLQLWTKQIHRLVSGVGYLEFRVDND